MSDLPHGGCTEAAAGGAGDGGPVQTPSRPFLPSPRGHLLPGRLLHSQGGGTLYFVRPEQNPGWSWAPPPTSAGRALVNKTPDKVASWTH